MSGPPIETDITPPDVAEDEGGDDRHARLGVHFIDINEVSYDAAVSLFLDNSQDAEQFADSLLNIALAIASMRGPEFNWAVMQRFAAYDGMSR